MLKVKNLSSHGDSRCRILEGLLGKKQQMIILLLIGTNAANTLFSLLGENFLFKMENVIRQNGAVHSPGFLFTTALLTPWLVIFGEIFPKVLFRHYSFSLTRLAAPLLNLMKIVMRPVVLPFSLLTFRSLKFNLATSSYNRKTINLLTESGFELGNIYLQQERLIRHVLNLSNITLDSLAEPLPKGAWITSDMDRQRAFQSIKKKRRIPFFVWYKEKIIGTLSLYDIWNMPQRSRVGNYITPITHLSSLNTGMQALEYMLAAKKQYVLVESGSRIHGFVSVWKLLGKGLSLR
jgi:putative hemolysin